MSWSNLNYYRLQGSITSGITLDSANPKAGSAPSGYLTYDDANYGSTTYAIGAYFHGEYTSSITNNQIRLNFTGSASRVNILYSGSYDGLTYEAWRHLIPSTGANTFYIDFPYFKIKGIFDNNLWSDPDGFYISAVNPYYKIFQKGTTISADHMNDNFKYVGANDFRPLGDTTLVPTTGAYDLGSDVYRWKNVYALDITATTVEVGGYTLYNIANYTITSPVSSIEFTGLNGDVDAAYKICGTLNFNTQSITTRLLGIVNGISSSSYISIEMIYSTAGAYSHSDNTFTAMAIARAHFSVFFEAFFYPQTGAIRSGYSQYTKTDQSTPAPLSAQGGFSSFSYANNVTTITSLKIYASGGNPTITSGKISLYALR
jgi:hypothetical protein